MVRGNITLFLSFTVVCMLLLGRVFAHPFYVSITEIRADNQKKTLTVSCRMFTDDLENALTRVFNRPFDLLNSSSGSNINHLLDSYIQARFSIGISGVLQKLVFVGFEHEEEATWCYLESKNYIAPGSLTVTNALLYDFISEQVHVIHVYVDGQRKSSRLVNPEKMASFWF